MIIGSVIGSLAFVAIVSTIIVWMMPKQSIVVVHPAEESELNILHLLVGATSANHAASIATKANEKNLCSTYRGHPASEHHYNGILNPSVGSENEKKLRKREATRIRLVTESRKKSKKADADHAAYMKIVTNAHRKYANSNQKNDALTIYLSEMAKAKKDYETTQQR